MSAHALSCATSRPPGHTEPGHASGQCCLCWFDRVGHTLRHSAWSPLVRVNSSGRLRFSQCRSRSVVGASLHRILPPMRPATHPGPACLRSCSGPIRSGLFPGTRHLFGHHRTNLRLRRLIGGGMHFRPTHDHPDTCQGMIMLYYRRKMPTKLDSRRQQSACCECLLDRMSGSIMNHEHGRESPLPDRSQLTLWLIPRRCAANSCVIRVGLQSPPVIPTRRTSQLARAKRGPKWYQP